MRRGRKASRWLISPRVERPVLNIRGTAVPPDTSSNVAIIVISPEKAGSAVTKVTASTNLRGGASSTNRTLTMSSYPTSCRGKARSSGG
jgi:hypothetical protein